MSNAMAGAFRGAINELCPELCFWNDCLDLSNSINWRATVYQHILARYGKNIEPQYSAARRKCIAQSNPSHDW